MNGIMNLLRRADKMDMKECEKCIYWNSRGPVCCEAEYCDFINKEDY